MIPDPAPLLRFGREHLLRLDRSLRDEWLETDGRGGYASSTVLLCHRRRYHGLLVAPFPGTVKRHVFLSRLEEYLRLAEGPPEEARSFPLSIARYAGTWSPHGHLSLQSFELGPWPSFVYRIGRTLLRREITIASGGRASLLSRNRGVRGMWGRRGWRALSVADRALRDCQVPRICVGPGARIRGSTDYTRPWCPAFAPRFWGGTGALSALDW